jgi:hypothetical protein
MKLQVTDYYIENGKYVFTREYLLKRGWCCENKCRHCPYKNKDEKSKREIEKK